MLTVVYCTRETNPKHREHLIKSSGLHKNIEVIEIINQGESLTSAYNRGLKQAKNNHVVFCHDDLIVETNQWGKKLLKQFSKNIDYGIIGVAGTKYMAASGQWWENKKKMYGRVQHTHEGNSWLSSYSDDLGQNLEEVVIVDGLFFAIDKTKIKCEFNESVEGFHFYDVTFCFENYLKGVKVGVSTMVRVNHQSIGMTNEAWEANRLLFADKFKDNLPVNIKKVLHKGQRLKVLIGCLNLRSDNPEEKYIMDLVYELKKENYDISLASNIDKKYGKILTQMGVKTYSLQEPAGFKLGDGKWKLKTAQGDIDSQPNTLYKISDVNFDIIHISQKPVIDHLLRLYPDTEIVSSIHSTDKTLDEPNISPQVKKYLAINDEIKNMLIEVYSIDSNMIDVAEDNNIIETYKSVLG